MFTVCSVLQSVGYKEAIILDTEYTDDYVQTAYVAHHAPGLLCLKRIYKLLWIYALSSCISSQAVITTLFYGKGKKFIADRVQNSADARNGACRVW